MRRLAIAIFIFCLAGAALAENSVPLQISPASKTLFNEEETAPTAVPSPGEVIVVGDFSGKDFEFSDIKNVAVKADGVLVPLFIEKKSLFDEFGDGIYVSFRFFFRTTPADIDKSSFQLVWGPDVDAQNELVESIKLDPANAANYREAVFSQSDKGGTTASIEIVADSSAELYFLWYLLPMAVILLLLTIRKYRAGDANNTTSA